MELGVKGLGRTGSYRIGCLAQGGHCVVAYDYVQDWVKAREAKGAEGAALAEAVVQELHLGGNPAASLDWIAL